jgi:hypothetical protein
MLYVLNVVLNGLKHVTSKGCNAWLVCDGKVMKSNPILQLVLGD